MIKIAVFYSFENYNMITIAFLYFIIIGNKNSEGNMKHKVRERKSSSSERETTTKPSSKTNSIDTKGIF
jgi:hypothetical protein